MEVPRSTASQTTDETHRNGITLPPRTTNLHRDRLQLSLTIIYYKYLPHQYGYSTPFDWPAFLPESEPDTVFPVEIKSRANAQRRLGQPSSFWSSSEILRRKICCPGAMCIIIYLSTYEDGRRLRSAHVPGVRAGDCFSLGGRNSSPRVAILRESSNQELPAQCITISTNAEQIAGKLQRSQHLGVPTLSSAPVAGARFEATHLSLTSPFHSCSMS